MAFSALATAVEPGSSDTTEEEKAGLSLTILTSTIQKFSLPQRTTPEVEATLRDIILDRPLLPQPVYRYADQSKGIIDGAVFSFAPFNDPEAVLALDAIQSGNATSWQFTFPPVRI
jgi:hypothetical protein